MFTSYNYLMYSVNFCEDVWSIGDISCGGKAKKNGSRVVVDVGQV